ncbi:FAD-dependent monooxygenase [Amycolatopsis anabasis]|uniref:FAD-dependent monooxygenase n=1 Tax=Amycolatopsis anabasis TaxID=1840409 RepID=UPI00131D21F2|nr:FAD-dependent monooxygenase [Amycolatopsis anabasis]
MAAEHVPVLVVGAGPVGVSTAVFLSHWGVRPLVIDKRDPTREPPRAGMSLRTHEIYRLMGLGPAVAEAGWIGYGATRGVVRDSALGTTMGRLDAPEAYLRRHETASPADSRLQLRHRRLLHVALDELRRRDVTVRFDTRLVDFAADGTGVRAVVADTGTGARREITADYLVAADGAGSGVRKRLGITMPDREVIEQLNTAFYSADLGGFAEEWQAHGCFVRNDKVFAAMFSMDGEKQWATAIMDYPGKPAERTELSEERTVELLHAAIGDDSIEIELHEVNAWEAAVGMASSFRQGRIFLVGDAAHVQSPAGALGMNTGIQDSHNLAWKLAAVLGGVAGPGLLDTYEPERRVAATASLALARGLHEGFQSERDGLSDLHARMAATYLRGMLCYGYPEGAVLTDGTPDGAPDVLENRGWPGYRFPHVWLGSGASRVSTVDLIGTSWTLLCGPRGRPWRFAADAAVREFGIDLRCHRIGGEAPEVTAEQQEEFCVAAGIEPDGAALVRPDGFLAWRTATLDPEPHTRLRAVLGELLDRR